MQTVSVVDRVDALAQHAGGLFNPPHNVVDRGKRAALMRDMAERGWRGPPLLVNDENALTGSHRIAAVAELWNRKGIDVPIRHVEVADLCAEFDIDWAALVERWVADSGDLVDLVARLIELLPRRGCGLPRNGPPLMTADTAHAIPEGAYGVEEHEVQGVLAALVGDRDGDDPSSWFAHLSSRRALLLAVASRVADMTAQTADEIYQDMGADRSYSKLGAALNLSRSRAQQLVERAARVNVGSDSRATT